MAAKSESTQRRIVELADKMKDDDEEVSEQEAAEMLDLIVMRASNLAAVKGGMDWEDVADKLETSSKIAKKMAERDE